MAEPESLPTPPPKSAKRQSYFNDAWVQDFQGIETQHLICLDMILTACITQVTHLHTMCSSDFSVSHGGRGMM